MLKHISLIINRLNAKMVKKGDMMSPQDVVFSLFPVPLLYGGCAGKRRSGGVDQ